MDTQLQQSLTSWQSWGVWHSGYPPGRVELEGPPDYLQLIALGEALERGLQPALADETPRTGDI